MLPSRTVHFIVVVSTEFTALCVFSTRLRGGIIGTLIHSVCIVSFTSFHWR